MLWSLIAVSIDSYVIIKAFCESMWIILPGESFKIQLFTYFKYLSIYFIPHYLIYVVIYCDLFKKNLLKNTHKHKQQRFPPYIYDITGMTSQWQMTNDSCWTLYNFLIAVCKDSYVIHMCGFYRIGKWSGFEESMRFM